MWSTRQTYPAQQKIPARPNTHTSLPHHTTLPPLFLLPPTVSPSCRRPPPLPPLLSVAATATPPSSTPPPVAQRAPAARLWVAIAAQAGCGDGVTARRGQEQRRCRSPGEDGTADGGAALRRREGRRRRIPARARAAPAAHRDFRVNICSSRFQCGFMKLFEGFCC